MPSFPGAFGVPGSSSLQWLRQFWTDAIAALPPSTASRHHNLLLARPLEQRRPLLQHRAWERALQGQGFSDEQVLFAYRSFNSFLLGYLLMESGARTLRDPQDGDGSMGSSDQPVPGGLSPTRTDAEQEAVADATSTGDQLDPQGDIEVAEFPTIHRLAERLAEDRFDEEFERGLERLLDSVAAQLD